MKKIRSIIILLFSCLSLTACNGQKDSSGNTQSGTQAGVDNPSAATDQTGYYDIFVQWEAIFQWEQENSPLAEKTNDFIGMQFYQGEPVQIWRERAPIDFAYKWDICYYKPDGSRETILHELDKIDYYKYGYLDQEGNFYWWKNTQYTPEGQVIANTCLKKYLTSEEVLFEKQLEPRQDILDIRQAADGRTYLTIHDKETRDKWLAELDPATGLITKLHSGQPIADDTHDVNLGISGNKPATFCNSRFMEINADDDTESCILSLKGTTYTRPSQNRGNYLLHDFRILEDGSVEVLWGPSSGAESILEKLRLSRVEKTLLILRAWTTGSWLARQVNSFNQSSETYHVIVENQAEDRDDLARLTSVQIASGKGPDIILGDLMQEYIPGMMEKGALEDLRPYMEKNGLGEDEYFPFAFSTWRDGDRIYGISPEAPSLTGYRIDSAVLGGTEEPNIETLVNVLRARYTQAGQENAVFLAGCDSQELLSVFLKGSDTLWGMVDWEKGSCDFSGELFAGILETARRYGDNDNSGEKTYIAEARILYDIFHFDELAERARDGKVLCGTLFDDGCHVAVTPRSTLAINANSINKEGAWEFLSFLLEDEAQTASSCCPATRNAFDIWVENARAEVADGRELHQLTGTRLPNGSWDITGETTFSAKDITDEIVAEYIEMLEDARPYPIRTAPILDIISKEAADYFNGSKSAAEVGKVVANRVQTYLDEGR